MTWKSDLMALAAIGMGAAFGIALTATVLEDGHRQHEVHVHIEGDEHGFEIDVEGDDARHDLTWEAEGDDGRQIKREIEREIRIERVREAEGERVFVGTGPQVDIMVEESEGSRVRIRGNSTFATGGKQPLIYVDGIRIQDRSYMETLEPTSIDRIEIVKGEAAKTLYGEEASGGVIQIFTKKDEEEGAPEGR